MTAGDCSPSPSCACLSPLSAPRRASCREGSQERDRPSFCITESGRLRLVQDEGPIVYVTEEGVLTPTEGAGTQVPCGLQWADIQLGPIVGVGGQATVHQTLHTPTTSFFALKVIRTVDHINQNVVLRELTHLLRGVCHPNIVTSHQAFYRDNQLHILMEYMDCGDLRSALQRVGPLPLPILASVTSQVLQGLDFLHERHIVHRDIKPSNLLLHSSGMVKISDFGIATIVPRSWGQQSDIAALGSHGYMSPERLNGEDCGTPSDIWSFGLTVAQAALGVYPFLSEDFNFDKTGNLRDSISTCGRLSIESQRPVPALLQPLGLSSSDRENKLPSPSSHRLCSTLLASPCYSLASASPSHCRRRNSTSWVLDKRESIGTVVSSLGRASQDSNPFTRELNLLEFTLMLQDPSLRVDFDKIIPLVHEWYPHWEIPEVPDALRHFIGCCIQHSSQQRWTCNQLLQHPLLQQAVSVQEMAQWLVKMLPVP